MSLWQHNECWLKDMKLFLLWRLNSGLKPGIPTTWSGWAVIFPRGPHKIPSVLPGPNKFDHAAISNFIIRLHLVENIIHLSVYFHRKLLQPSSDEEKTSPHPGYVNRNYLQTSVDVRATTLCRPQTCILVQTLPKMQINGLKKSALSVTALSIMG